jgi:GNAT superfamily N-acetyltransferase
MEIIKAERRDLPSILALQKLAYQSEAELVGDYTIPPLTQTLEGITEDFNSGIMLKAVEGGDLIGSVRVRYSDHTLSIGRLIVSPPRQNQGVGTALLLAAEALHPQPRGRFEKDNDALLDVAQKETLHPRGRFELFTSDKSDKNLSLYLKNGYMECRREPLNEDTNMVFLEKFV